MKNNIYKYDDTPFISKKGKTFIIAEAGINHNGDIDAAKKLITLASLAGADAVKFQSFDTALLMPHNEPKMPYQIRNENEIENQFDMIRRTELDRNDHIKLINHCRSQNIEFISTPYDIKNAEMLIGLGVRILKIASTDVNNIPFLRRLKSLKIPLIISTGLTPMDELKKIMGVFVSDKDSQIALLHCVSDYPAPIGELNLNCIKTMENQFECPVGFSDHTVSVDVGAYAVCAGAGILEKHFTLDKMAEGPDHAASLTPDELKIYINKVREAEKALGDSEKRIAPCEKMIKPSMQRSLVAAVDISRGKIIKEEDLWAMRPATGISPLFVDDVVGKKLKNAKRKFEQIRWEDLEDA